MNGGIAVLDFETTGLFAAANDRAVEVGIVLLNSDFEIEGEFETLINPLRDVGASKIHKIESRWLLDAPTFPEILPELSRILHQRVLVAHNARFDIDFLVNEYRRASENLELTEDSYVCTMQLSKWIIPSQKARSLEALTSQFGLVNRQPHSAFGDAQVTAELLRAYARQKPELGNIFSEMVGVDFGDVMAHRDPEIRVVARPRDLEYEAPSFIERLVAKLSPVSHSPAVDDYLDLLSRALLDGILSEAETRSLVQCAEDLGLSVDDVESAHKNYFRSLAARAWEDGILTEFEISELTAISELLGVGEIELEAAKLGAPVMGDLLVATANPLTIPGALVALTGEMDPPKSVIKQLLIARGLVPVESISKKVSALIAADPDSLSGKALSARKNGIPIISAQKAHTLLLS